MEDSNSTKGIGLGLYICRKLCLQYEGSISCKSKVGRGTTINFTMAMHSEEVSSIDESEPIMMSFGYQERSRHVQFESETALDQSDYCETSRSAITLSPLPDNFQARFNRSSIYDPLGSMSLDNQLG
jgi:Histidine kinase-, DNA gyrase B-, and HSP90-like ATPase